MSIESMIPSIHLILCRPLLLLPSVFPSIRVFTVRQLFESGGQSTGVSASTSVLPMNTQNWSPLGWTGWISCSPRNSQESSPTPQFKSINSWVLSLLYGPTLTSVHDYWKNDRFDYMHLCLQTNVCFLIHCLGLSLFSSKEQTSYNFMASITVCSDFGAQKDKVWHCFCCFPIYFPWSDGTRCHDLRFLNVEL